MPSLPPFSFKTAPIVRAPAAPVTIVRQPMMSVSFGSCATSIGTFSVDQMPLMDREPETIPNVPGGGYSYAGMGLEYGTLNVDNVGVSPINAIPAVWSGFGAVTWTVWADGLVVGTLNARDGQIGASTSVDLGAVGLNQRLPHTYWLTATYHDRPAYIDYYFDASTIGVIAFGKGIPVDPGCGIGSIFWNTLDYWDRWVAFHHAENILGPPDRYGVLGGAGLTGPWGSAVPKQHLRSDDAPPCLDAYAISLFDFANEVTYPEVTYPVESNHQLLTSCNVALPIFNQTQGMKVGT